MYTLINAFSDVAYELISALSPKPILWFDIDKNPYRLYLCASHKLKNADPSIVCDCVVYCSDVFGKDIKHVVFANKNITEEGLKSLMRLAKRVKDKNIKIEKAFVTKELQKVVNNFNDSAIEAVGEAIINGVSYDEYIKCSGYNKHDFKVDPDAMWVVTHQVLNHVKQALIKKSVNKRSSYIEVVNSYISESHGVDTSSLVYFHKIYNDEKIDMKNAANMFIKALNEGIDLTPFLKEKRLLNIYNDYVTVDEFVPTIRRDFDYNPIGISNKALVATLMHLVLEQIYYTRLSGVDEETIIKYLRAREKLSTVDFINKLDDITLLQQGISI